MKYEVFTIISGVETSLLKTNSIQKASSKYQRHGIARVRVDGRMLLICEADKQFGRRAQAKA